MKRCAFSLFGRPTGFLLILLLAFPALYALSPTEGSPRILLPGRSIWPMDREWTFKIPYLGSRPTHWAIKHLPEGFTFDSHEGIIRGKASSRIVFEFEISAANESGADSCIWQVEVSRYNGLAPVMGWSTRWLKEKEINEQTILDVADAMQSKGLVAAGYNHIIIESHWQTSVRDSDGRIKADPLRFPNGIKHLADELHRRGMRLGLSSNASPLNVHGLSGSFEKEAIDAATFSEWGVDFIKYDYCCSPPISIVAQQRYGAMGRALAATGRPPFFSVCEWGELMPWSWGITVRAGSWRTSFDIQDKWKAGRYSKRDNGIWDAAMINLRYAQHANRGRAISDPDLLLIGSPSNGCTAEEYHAQMQMWAMMRAPLVFAADPRSVSAEAVALLTHPDLIAVDQDASFRNIVEERRADGTHLWTRQLTKGTAVLVMNAGESPTTTSIASRPDSSSAWDVSRAAYVPPSDLGRIVLSPHAARLFVFE